MWPYAQQCTALSGAVLVYVYKRKNLYVHIERDKTICIKLLSSFVVAFMTKRLLVVCFLTGDPVPSALMVAAMVKTQQVWSEERFFLQDA